jgi:tetratricopeptide (TPR) repeat protein
MLAIQVDPATLDLEKFAQSDPKIDDYRQANSLVVEAKRLIDLQQYAEGSRKAVEALNLVPEHAEALYQAWKAHTGYAAAYQRRLSREVSLEQNRSAIEYGKRLAKVAPSDVRTTLATLLTMSNNAVEKFRSGNVSEAVSDQRMVLDAANRILSSGKVADSRNLAYVYHVRSTAKFNIVKNQGGTDISDALRDNSEAMRLEPKNLNYPLDRALKFEAIGRMSEARYWHERVREIREAID